MSSAHPGFRRSATGASARDGLMPRRVLLVEEDDALRTLFADILSDRGHLVTVAADSGSALELLRGGEFDVLVTELRLRGGSGLDLLAWAQRTQPTLCAVVASAFSTSELTAQALRLGARVLLRKPIEPALLLRAIEVA